MDMPGSLGQEPLLEVRDLRVSLPLEEGRLTAVDGVSLSIAPGRTLGLVGESGCGKTMTAQTIMRLSPRSAEISGSILLRLPEGGVIDTAAVPWDGPEIRRVRGGLCAMVFQEPMTSFSPLHTIGNQIVEAILLHRTPDRREAAAIAIAMLDRVGIPEPKAAFEKYPHHLSGGMRQRAMIAMALSCQPRLLIADEPTTALDVTVQAQVLRLMRTLQDEFGMAILYISHDLGVIAQMADEVAIMYLGRIVERASAADLFRTPRHPYTQALLRAVPRLGKRSKERLEAIRGSVPSPLAPRVGCSFFNRCSVAMPGLCDRHAPALVDVAQDHGAACFRYPAVLAAAGLEAAPAAAGALTP
jgi:peptide/nickel transport system ATP-binding protein